MGERTEKVEFLRLFRLVGSFVDELVRDSSMAEPEKCVWKKFFQLSFTNGSNIRKKFARAVEGENVGALIMRNLPAENVMVCKRQLKS